MWPKSDLQHEIVLQSSSQCLPMIRYNRKSLRSISPQVIGKGEAYILRFTNSLRMILDELFNGGVKATPLSSSAAEIPIFIAAAPVAPAFSTFGKTYYNSFSASAHGITQSFGTPAPAPGTMLGPQISTTTSTNSPSPFGTCVFAGGQAPPPP